MLIEDPSTILELKGSTALGFGSVPATRVTLFRRLTLIMLGMAEFERLAMGILKITMLLPKCPNSELNTCD